MRSLQFIQTIGAGAFGTVYLCRLTTDQGFSRNVALKVLQSQANAGMFLSRIRDEARLLGLLQDNAIIKVMDLVEVQGRQAVLMEYVEGADLESLVNALGAPTPRCLAEIIATTAGALGRAHTATDPASGEPLNVIHRDVKPANIMVSSGGAVKLLDFGVARARFDARESVTGQLVLGTLNYMAPEYVVTGKVTTAADVYGLGLTLWQGATGEVFGQPKVRKKDHLERLRRSLEALPAEMSGLSEIISQMLAWTPEKRPDAHTVEQYLDDAIAGLAGPGLRAWARDKIPTVLQGRAEVADEAGLLGLELMLDGDLDDSGLTDSSFPGIGTGSESAPHTTQELDAVITYDSVQDATQPSLDRDVTTPSGSPDLQTHVVDPPEAAEHTDDASTERIRRLPSQQSLALPILKGLLIGATVGLFLLMILTFTLYKGWL